MKLLRFKDGQKYCTYFYILALNSYPNYPNSISLS